ncbi:MAG: hypothetical protein U0Q12_26185 [Vicinamibacterales bacterium]
MRYSSCVMSVCVVMAVAAGVAAQKPVMTEQQFQAAMKETPAALSGLKKNLDAQMGPEAAKDAEKLVTIFKDVEAFWVARKNTDAAQMAKDSWTAAEAAGKAASAKDFAAATTAHGTVGGLCRKCHTAYREGTPETGFKIKSGE